MPDPGDHFAAFSFVDRITEFTSGTRARGAFHVPATLPAFPSCLVAEAVGRLAAGGPWKSAKSPGRPAPAAPGKTRSLNKSPPCTPIAARGELSQATTTPLRIG